MKIIFFPEKVNWELSANDPELIRLISKIQSEYY